MFVWTHKRVSRNLAVLSFQKISVYARGVTTILVFAFQKFAVFAKTGLGMLETAWEAQEKAKTQGCKFGSIWREVACFKK